MHKELSLHANWLVPTFFDEQMKERQMSRLWQLWGWVSRRSNGLARNTPRLQFHYMPKHGSWLNMAELELSVLARQCLDQRLLSMERHRSVIAPWQRGCSTMSPLDPIPVRRERA